MHGQSYDSLHDEGQSFNGDSSKIKKAVVKMRRKVIDTECSLDKAYLSSSIITQEGQNILSLIKT